MTMRILTLIYLVLLLIPPLLAQNGFNKRYGGQLPSAVFYNLLLDGDTLVIYGIGLDSQQYIVISWIDSMGNLLNYKTYRDGLDADFTSNLNYDIKKTSTGNYVLVGEVGNAPWTYWMELMPDGTQLHYKKYNRPNILAALQGKIIETSDGYLICGAIQLPDFSVDIFVMKIDLEGNKEWEKFYGDPDVNEICWQIFQLENNEFIISGGHSNIQGPTLPFWWAQSWIFAIDSLGNKLWEFEGPKNEEINAVGIQHTPDGNWIYGSGTFELLGNNEWGSRSKIVCRDSNMNLLWETVISPTTYSTNTIVDIKPSPDGNYVVIGRWSTPQVPGEVNYRGGSISKISPEGELLWNNIYSGYPTNVPGSRNFLGGVVILPSGSIVATGYSQRFHPTYVAPQGWVIKISPDGCVVDTLCLTSAVEELEQSEEEVTVFPNPATDYVVFQAQSETGIFFNIAITDLMGKLVWEYHGKKQEKQVVWDAASVSGGIYFYRFDGETPLKTGKIILR